MPKYETEVGTNIEFFRASEEWMFTFEREFDRGFVYQYVEGLPFPKAGWQLDDSGEVVYTDALVEIPCCITTLIRLNACKSSSSF